VHGEHAACTDMKRPVRCASDPSDSQAKTWERNIRPWLAVTCTMSLRFGISFFDLHILSALNCGCINCSDGGHYSQLGR
jgi:hypothetical protein